MSLEERIKVVPAPPEIRVRELFLRFDLGVSFS